MEFGLLWYDDSPNRPLADKVLRAAAQYQLKFGQAPTVCFVNPATLEGELPAGRGGSRGLEVGDVQIEAMRTVLPHHFLVAVSEARRDGRAKRRKSK